MMPARVTLLTTDYSNVVHELSGFIQLVSANTDMDAGVPDPPHVDSSDL